MKSQSDNHHWYVLLDGKRRGPLSFADLTKAARDGVVTAETNIWRSGWRNWHAAKSVKGLVPEQVEAPLAPDDTVWADEQPVRPPKEAAYQARAPREAAYQPYLPPDRRDRRPAPEPLRRAPEAPRQDLRRPDARTADNRIPDNRIPDSRTPDSRTPDSRVADSRADTRFSDPRGSDPRGSDPRGSDPRGSDPRGSDPRGSDSRAGDARADDIFADEWRMLARQRPEPRPAADAPRTRGADLPARVAQRMQVQDNDLGRDRRHRQQPRQGSAFGRVLRRTVVTVLIVLLAGGGVVLLQSGVLRTKSGSGARAALMPAETSGLPAQVAALPAVVTLQRNDPDAFERFRKRFTAAGTSDEDVMTTARNALRKSVKHLLAISSGDVLIDITETSLAYLQGLQATNPESCVALSDESKGARLTSNLARELPGLFSREMSVLERIAATNPHIAVAPMSSAEARPYFDKVLAVLMRQSVRTELQSRDRLDPSEFQPYCALVIAFYQAVLDLPRDDKVNLLRHLYATAAVNADADLLQR